jgi:hypothetical protein
MKLCSYHSCLWLVNESAGGGTERNPAWEPGVPHSTPSSTTMPFDSDSSPLLLRIHLFSFLQGGNWTRCSLRLSNFHILWFRERWCQMYKIYCPFLAVDIFRPWATSLLHTTVNKCVTHKQLCFRNLVLSKLRSFRLSHGLFLNSGQWSIWFSNYRKELNQVSGFNNRNPPWIS